MVWATVQSQVQANFPAVGEGSTRKGSFGSPMDQTEIASMFRGSVGVRRRR